MRPVQVKQWIYEDFGDYEGIELGTVTEWYNGEGIDITIERKKMSPIFISLGYSDIRLLRKMFIDSGY